jgi:NAD(P)-dependent dehydrogenase (short-subunit alcohol dehydrogenase family)
MTEAVFRLDGRVALVTGASRGIGAAISRELARAGANVVLVGRSMDHLARVADDVSRMGGVALSCLADVADPAQVRRSVDDALAQFQHIDILVNNAGLNSRGPYDAINADEWSAVLNVNLGAAFYYVQALAGGMRQQRWGRIINIASITGQTGEVQLKGRVDRIQ